MLDCGHDRPPFGDPVCEHVRLCRQPYIEQVRWLIGRGLGSHLLCAVCAKQRAEGAPVVVGAICEECFVYATTEVGNLTAVRGTPGIQERPEPLDARLVETPLPRSLGEIVDFAPVDGVGESVWLLLLQDGRLVRFEAERLACTTVASSALPPEPHAEPWAGRVRRRRLHASRGGEFAAVVTDYGRYGQILDLRSGRATLALDGGDYLPETVPFSFDFFEARGRVFAVHRTAWNRLDVSDPSTGELLTARGPTSYQRGESCPPHYLDYFHGALHVSPGGSHVLDDGWIWHPVGVPEVWSLQRWILENPWESEDGPTKRHLAARDYWDHGAAWLNETTVAIAGIGEDDEAMIDGARIFTVTEPAPPVGRGRPGCDARELLAFPGPAGLFFSADGHLFSSSPAGLSRWDPGSGARTGQLAGFQPTRHHRGAGELAAIGDGVLVRWRCGGQSAPP